MEDGLETLWTEVWRDIGFPAPTIGQDQSALLKLLESLQAVDVADRVRQAAETIYQALIEAELTAMNAAANEPRSATGTVPGR